MPMLLVNTLLPETTVRSTSASPWSETAGGERNSPARAARVSRRTAFDEDTCGPPPADGEECPRRAAPWTALVVPPTEIVSRRSDAGERRDYFSRRRTCTGIVSPLKSGFALGSSERSGTRYSSPFLISKKYFVARGAPLRCIEMRSDRVLSAFSDMV